MIAQTLGHLLAFRYNVRIDIDTDDAASTAQHIAQVIVHDKGQIRLAAGTVKQQNFLAVILLEHGCNQFDIVIDLIVLSDHVVFDFAVRSQNADLTQQRCSLISLNQILSAVVKQRVVDSCGILRSSLLLGLLHRYTLCIDRNGNNGTAFGIYKRAVVIQLGLLVKEGDHFLRVNRTFGSLKDQQIIVFFASLQRSFKFFIAGFEDEFGRNEIIAILFESSLNADQQQFELVLFALLHR